ncbi:MAG: folylpolyglutamate synthase/dihydrofolate synthase family protein [Candidatus Firestonebacteria bacterium]
MKPAGIAHKRKVNKAEKFLNGLSDYEKTTGYSYSAAYFNLKRMKHLLFLLGNPHLKVPAIHVAGTKGKGSVSNYIAAILTAAGLRTGLYTSPHILTFKERIKIDGKMITERELDILADKIKPLVLKLDKETKYGRPTFFEVYTAMGFLYFFEKKIDAMVLEAGMGGRLDATNVVHPLVSVITPISLDHVKELGNTLEKIAGEKAGIIKAGVPVVSAPQEKGALGIIKKRAGDLKAVLKVEGSDFSHKVRSALDNGISFDLKGLGLSFNNIKSGMFGAHQALNASVALAAVELAAGRLGISSALLKKTAPKAISKMLLPGRVQVISRKPFIIADAAHNTASAKVLLSSLRVFKYNRLVMVLGMSANKDFKGFLKIFEKDTDFAVYVRSSNYRSADPEDLFRVSNIKNGKVFNEVSSGIDYALKNVKKGGLICITGSFYVLCDAFKYLKKRV